MNQPDFCPCCSGKKFADCCQPFMNSVQLPEKPEQLMRSRYSAFATKQYAYITDTNFSSDPLTENSESIEEDYKNIHWLKLNVEETSDSGPLDAAGWVNFSAYYGIKNKVFVLKECSNFKRINGKWFYDIDSSDSKVERIKLSRNDPCICQSGNKFKKCCERKLI